MAERGRQLWRYLYQRRLGLQQTAITSISPFFIVRHVPAALSFYCQMLSFKIVYQEPDH
jgi:hypothetical protein